MCVVCCVQVVNVYCSSFQERGVICILYYSLLINLSICYKNKNKFWALLFWHTNQYTEHGWRNLWYKNIYKICRSYNRCVFLFLKKSVWIRQKKSGSDRFQICVPIFHSLCTRFFSDRQKETSVVFFIQIYVWCMYCIQIYLFVGPQQRQDNCFQVMTGNTDIAISSLYYEYVFIPPPTHW